MTASPLEYRRYNNGDLPAVKALHKAALQAANAYDEGNIRKILDADFADIEGYYFSNGGTFLLGFSNNEAISSGALAFVSPGIFEVCRMRVHPNHQGKRYGKAMYQRLEQHARDEGAAMLILRTDVRLSTAQRFYADHGFKQCMPTARHWGNTANFTGALYFEKVVF